MADFKSTIELKAVTRDIDKKLQGVNRGLVGVQNNVRNTQGQFQKIGGVGARSMGNIERSSRRLNKTLMGVRASMSGLVTTMKVVGTLAGGILAGKAVGSAVTFEKSMGAVNSVLNGTKEQMKALTAESLRLGKSTSFTAGQSAAAMEKLAMAGFGADQVLAATKDTLALAAAGSLGLAEAADISSNVLAGFSLKVADLGNVTDVMAKAAASSNTSVGELGSALSYVGPIAEQSGVSLAETTAAIGKLSDAGIKGSRAGTNVRQMLLKLQAPTTKAQKVLDKLGIETRDNQGHFRGLTTVMKEFGEATQDSADYSAVFGVIASSGAGVIAKAAKDGGLQKLTGNLNEATGAAKKMAEIRLDNLAGSLTKMKSAWDGLTQTIIQGGVMNFARAVIDNRTKNFQNMEIAVKKLKENWKEVFTASFLIDAAKERVDAAMAGISKSFAEGGYFNNLGKVLSKEFLIMSYIVIDSIEDLADAGVSAFKTMYSRFIGISRNIKNDVIDLFYELYDVMVGRSIIPDLVDDMVYYWERMARPWAEASIAMTSATVMNFINMSDRLSGIVRGMSALISGVFGSYGASVAAGLATANASIINHRYLLDGLGDKLAALGKYIAPIAVVLNFDAIKTGIGDIINNLLKGDFIGAIKSIGRGIDSYISTSIKGMTKLFKVAFDVLNQDATAVIDSLPKTFDAISAAIDTVRNKLGGLVGYLSGALGPVIKGLYNTIQALMDLLIGLDAESIGGSLAAIFLTFKASVAIAKVVWAKFVAYLFESTALMTVKKGTDGGLFKAILSGKTSMAAELAKFKAFAAQAGAITKKASIAAGMATVNAVDDVAAVTIATKSSIASMSRAATIAGTPVSIMDKALFGVKGVKGSIAKLGWFARIVKSSMLSKVGIGLGLMFAADFAMASDSPEFEMAGENAADGVKTGFYKGMGDVETSTPFKGVDLIDMLFLSSLFVGTSSLKKIKGFFSKSVPRDISTAFGKVAPNVGAKAATGIFAGMARVFSGPVGWASLVLTATAAAGEMAGEFSRNFIAPMIEDAQGFWRNFENSGMSTIDTLVHKMKYMWAQFMMTGGDYTGDDRRDHMGVITDDAAMRNQQLGVKEGAGFDIIDKGLATYEISQIGEGLAAVTVTLDETMAAIWSKYANKTPGYLKSFDPKSQTEDAMRLIQQSVDAGLIDAKDGWGWFKNAESATADITEAIGEAGAAFKQNEAQLKAGIISTERYLGNVYRAEMALKKVYTESGVQAPKGQIISEDVKAFVIGQAKLNALLREEVRQRNEINAATGTEDVQKLEKTHEDLLAAVVEERKVMEDLAKRTYTERLLKAKETYALQKSITDSEKEYSMWSEPERDLAKYHATLLTIRTAQEKINDKTEEARILVERWAGTTMMEEWLEAGGTIPEMIAKISGSYAKTTAAWKTFNDQTKSGETELERLIQQKVDAELAFNAAVKGGTKDIEGQLVAYNKMKDSEIQKVRIKEADEAATKKLNDEITSMGFAARAAGISLEAFDIRAASSMKALQVEFVDRYGAGWMLNIEASDEFNAISNEMHRKMLEDRLAHEFEVARQSESVWEGVTSGVKKFFNDTKTAGAAFQDAMTQSLGSIKSSIGGMLKGGMQQMDPRTAIMGVVQPFLDASIDNLMNSAFGGLFGEEKKATITSDGAMLTTDVAGAEGDIKAAANKTLSEKLSEHTKTFGDMLGKKWESFTEILGEGWNSFKGILDGIDFGGIFGGGGGGGGLFSGIANVVGGLFGGGDTQTPIGLASGGIVPDPENPEAGPTDTVPAMLTPGELVIPEAEVDSISSGDEGPSGAALMAQKAIPAVAGLAAKGIAGAMGGVSAATGNAALMAAATALQAAAAALTTAGTGLTASGTSLTGAGTTMSGSITTASTSLTTASTSLTGAGTTMSTALGASTTTLTTAGAALTAAAGMLKAAAIANSFADGGPVKGKGSGTSDSIQAWLSDGEYVINAEATKKFAPLLEAINTGKMDKLRKDREKLPTFKIGGGVGSGGVAHSDRRTGGAAGDPVPITGLSPGKDAAGTVYNTTHINVSGNVDQRSIDQIKKVISQSPDQVNNANQAGQRKQSGLRKPSRR